MAYNPGNWNVYAQGMQSLQQGAASLGEGIADWGAKSKLTKSMRTMFQTLDPENKEMYDSMGLPQLQGKLQSISVQQGINTLKQQQEQLQENKNIGLALQRYSTGPAAQVNPSAIADYGPMGDQAPASVPQGIQDYGPTGDQAPPAAAAARYQPSQEDRVRYALQTPGLGGSGAVKLLQVLQQYAPAGKDELTQARIGLIRAQTDAAKSKAGTGGEIAPKMTTLNGLPVIYNPKSGTFHVVEDKPGKEEPLFTKDDLSKADVVPGAPGMLRVPTGPNTSQLINVSQEAPVVSAMADEDGKPTGKLGYKNGNKWVVFDDPTYAGPTLDLRKPNGEVIPGYLYHPKAKKVLDVRSTLQKAAGDIDGKTNAPAASSPKEQAKASIWDDFSKWLKPKK